MKIISWNVANRIRKQPLQLDALVSKNLISLAFRKLREEHCYYGWKDLKRKGIHTISSLGLHGGNSESTGARRYGVLIAS